MYNTRYTKCGCGVQCTIHGTLNVAVVCNVQCTIHGTLNVSEHSECILKSFVLLTERISADYSKDRYVLQWGENGMAAAQLRGHCATPQQTMGDQCFITSEISTDLNRFPCRWPVRAETCRGMELISLSQICFTLYVLCWV